MIWPAGSKISWPRRRQEDMVPPHPGSTALALSALQIQERMTTPIAGWLELEPRRVGVVLESEFPALTTRTPHDH